VAHQLAGLANPFDPYQSTLLFHLGLAESGVISGVTHPIGLGTGATSLASEKQGTPGASTEVDVSNEFVALGLVGGLLFAALVLVTLARFGRASLTTRDPLVLATTGILVVCLGEWLNGGLYALTPLLWTLVGWGSVRAGRRFHQPIAEVSSKLPSQSIV
jgi:hypothetical protein